MAAMKTITHHARTLRRSQTREEQRLWYMLRDRRFAHYKFRRQHPVGRYILDFACCSVRLAIELDGGQHACQVEYDRHREAWLRAQGWRVIRFWNNQLWEDEEAVMEAILGALEMR